tara:strand:- start:127 stop:537 length:411 start_codon:yes stop_codon:yes gene_type:complete
MKIKGVLIIKKPIFKNKKGKITKFIDRKDKIYKKFGEVYLNEIYRNKIKGWICHKKTSSLLKVIIGKVEFNLVDKRKNSKTYKNKIRVILSDKINKILKIPNGVWFCFKGKNKKSLIINLIEMPHSDKETIREDII